MYRDLATVTPGRLLLPELDELFSLWADEDDHYPLHVLPCTPAKRSPKVKVVPVFRIKP